MSRIVVNKHYSDSTQITADKFVNSGEIIISNEYGFEGIYILNTNGQAIKIGNKVTSGSTDSGSTEYVDAEFVKNYLRAQAYVTSAKTAEMLSVLEQALNERIDNIVIPEPSSGGSGYSPAEIVALNDKLNVLSASTEQHIAESVNDFQELNDRIDRLSGLTIEFLNEEQVKEVVQQEIAFLVSSADSMFNVLREIADWVTNDETGSAQLISDVAELKDAVSGLTEDLSITDGRVSELSGALGTHIAQNELDLQELSDKIDAIEIPEIPEQVSDEHIQEIAAQEVAKLVSSADSMYQVLQELADWVESDETGSAQLINDVATLNGEVEELSGSVITNQENISELSAETESLKNLVENLPIPSGSPVDESVIQALKDYIDEKIASIKYESDHVFLSRSQYYELVVNGSVVIDGKVHEYSDDIYYCIYDEQVPPTSGDSSYDYDEETGMIEISGDTEVTDGMLELAGAVLDGDGFVTINNVEPTPSDEPDVDEEGLVDVSNLPIDEDGFVELPNNWEII